MCTPYFGMFAFAPVFDINASAMYLKKERKKIKMEDRLNAAISRRSFMGGALAVVGGLAESFGYYRGVIDALNLPLRA